MLQTAKKIIATVAINPRGFGFLLLPHEQVAFVAPPDLNPFLAGDEVEAVISETRPGRWQASQLQLRKRGRREVFVTLVRHRKLWHGRIDRNVANTDWPLDVPSHQALEEGESWICEVIEDRLRPIRKVEDEALERCIARHGLSSEFSLDLLEAADAAACRPDPLRRDLRSIPTVTIDAPSTRDIDDAVAALPPEPDGSIRVLISIADVDALVAENSPLDQEARRRATSVYLAGQVLPMFPEAISAEKASLLPDCERPALTAELRIDVEGRVTSVDLYPSLIRSCARLSYESVSAFLVELEDCGMSGEVGSCLRRLRTAAARLGAQRAARGGVEMAREEAYVSFDPHTRQPDNLVPQNYTMAHRMVERLMVAANEAVAGWLQQRGLAALYRVHGEPDREKVSHLDSIARNFGLELALGASLSPRSLAALEIQVRDTPVAPALLQVLSRILGPARYTSSPGSHFGLAAPLYLHFTSPIRRYADLVVHRLVKRYLEGERSLPEAETLENLAVHLNQCVFRATKAENDRYRMLAAQVFRRHIGKIFDGNIIAVKPFGLVVQLSGTGATGTVASDTFPSDDFTFEPERDSWTSVDQSLAVGDFVEVEVVGVQEELGRIELRLIEE